MHYVSMKNILFKFKKKKTKNRNYNIYVPIDDFKIVRRQMFTNF